jgi:HEPN domain-containing protein
MTDPMEFRNHSLQTLMIAQRNYQSAEQHKTWYKQGSKKNDYTYTSVCLCAYELQQCVEKILKAILSFSNTNYELTHDIARLILATDTHTTFKANDVIRRKAFRITNWEAGGRYAGFMADAKEIFDTMRPVMTLLRKAKKFTGFNF